MHSPGYFSKESAQSGLLFVLVVVGRGHRVATNSTTIMATKKTTNPKLKLPSTIIDAHHHFVDTAHNEFNAQFLRPKLPNVAYLPSDYQRDVVEKLQAHGIQLVGSVHMEALPDDGLAEAQWVQSLINDKNSNCTVKAIVAGCDLASPDAAAQLHKLKQLCPDVHAVRWILDCADGGPFAPDTASHVGIMRHAEGKYDYLRGSQGEPLPEFVKGVAQLESSGLPFDLQCAPAQLVQAAALFARFPNIPVCINHLGKPRPLGVDEDESGASAFHPSEAEMEEWRVGMKAMAQLPRTFVKISMLGYIVPGWIKSQEKIDFVKKLVQETVTLFGPKRCMVALNWWNDAAMSDSDGRSAVGPDPVKYIQYMASFFEEYTEEERHRLFVGTAREFYKF